MNRYLISVLGAVIGAATTGLWLGMDLLTPEPIGDYLLFFLMGISNVVIGWQVGRLAGKSRKVSQTKPTGKGMSPYSN